MKKAGFYLFALLSVFAVAPSCEKAVAGNETQTPDVPRTTVPDAYAGKWKGGTFDMSKFDSYDGTRQPNATNMVAYDIKKDGSAQQYIYYTYDDGSGKQVLTYRTGTVTFDTATATLRFCPQKGLYRLFENGSNSQHALNSDGLYPAYAPAYRDCAFEEFERVLYLVGTNDQNERIGFAKATW